MPKSGIVNSFSTAKIARTFNVQFAYVKTNRFRSMRFVFIFTGIWIVHYTLIYSHTDTRTHQNIHFLIDGFVIRISFTIHVLTASHWSHKKSPSIRRICSLCFIWCWGDDHAYFMHCVSFPPFIHRRKEEKITNASNFIYLAYTVLLSCSIVAFGKRIRKK